MEKEFMQQKFNQMCAGLASQGFQKCMTVSGSCVFRGPNGFRCAVGHAFECDLTAEENRNSLSCLPREAKLQLGTLIADEEGRLPLVAINFYWRMQDAHDNATDAEDMKRRLREVAQSCKLEIPEVLS